MIRVRLAESGDQGRLVDFIREHWSSTHIFAQRPEVFAWQHLQHDGRLNMVLAEDDPADGRPVLGVLGFIPTGRYDPALDDRDVALAIWKVRDVGAPPGLGLRLLKFLHEALSPRVIFAIGISQYVRPIYEVLGYQVGELHHAALFRPGRYGETRVAVGVPGAAFASARSDPGGLELTALDASTPSELRLAVDRIGAAASPAKSWRYLDERFLRHPWYRYEVRAVRRDGEVVSVVVWRAVQARGARILRIVDVVADTSWLRDATCVLQRELTTADAEYIDLVQWGIDDAVLADGGFVDPSTTPGLVLPNYFSPFEQRNVRIGVAVKASQPDLPVRLYRADSDQDRPNLPDDLEHAH